MAAIRRVLSEVAATMDIESTVDWWLATASPTHPITGSIYWSIRDDATADGGGVPATDHQPDFEKRVKLFGAKVRSRRAELGLSERKLAELASVSRGYVSLLLKDRGSHKDENDDYKLPNPTLDVIWRLADALEVDVAYLVDYSRSVERNPSRSAS